ncbi:hypothetical protein FHG87_016011 [Trinorchestia longiramus]|nr:hypothetical protein FHG87_016011 [Trinorchestia longiramus]
MRCTYDHTEVKPTPHANSDPIMSGYQKPPAHDTQVPPTMSFSTLNPNLSYIEGTKLSSPPRERVASLVFLLLRSGCT